MKIYHLIFWFLLYGCSSAYIPSSKNVPLFERKGEVQIEAGASTNSLFLTGSYAFSEKYALIANGSMAYCYLLGDPVGWYDGGEQSLVTDGDVPHRSMEVGLGRYNLLPSTKRRLEIFAGAGYGAAHYFNSDFKQNYLQGFVQANTGRKYRHFELGWSLRAAYSGFRYTDSYPRLSSSHQGYENVIEHRYYQVFHLEPLFVIRTGGPRLKASFRAGITPAFPLSSSTPIVTWRGKEGYTLFQLSCGLSYRF